MMQTNFTNNTMTIWMPFKNGNPMNCAKHFYMESGELMTRPYDKLREGVFRTVEIESIDKLFQVINMLGSRSGTCVVNALPLFATDNTLRRRLMNPDEFSEATTKPYSHSWVCIDYDQGVPDDVNPSEVAEYIVANFLPEDFKDVSYVSQFSSSAGVKTWGKMHFWFMMDTPLNSDEANDFIEPKRHKLDEATLRNNQILYTANPTFDGLEDPVVGAGLTRINLVKKSKDAVKVDMAKIEKKRKAREELEAKYANKKPAESNESLAVLAKIMLNEIKITGTMHYPDLLKLGSSLRRCGLCDLDIATVLNNMKCHTSGANVKEIIAANKKNTGMSTGIPYLEKLCGMTIKEATTKLMSMSKTQ